MIFRLGNVKYVTLRQFYVITVTHAFQFLIGLVIFRYVTSSYDKTKEFTLTVLPFFHALHVLYTLKANDTCLKLTKYSVCSIDFSWFN